MARSSIRDSVPWSKIWKCAACSNDVTVIAWGEFGRTPRINKDAGRDHWSQVSCALLAGGGMKTGQAIGSTDRMGAYRPQPAGARTGSAGHAVSQPGHRHRVDHDRRPHRPPAVPGRASADHRIGVTAAITVSAFEAGDGPVRQAVPPAAAPFESPPGSLIPATADSTRPSLAAAFRGRTRGRGWRRPGRRWGPCRLRCWASRGRSASLSRRCSTNRSATPGCAQRSVGLTWMAAGFNRPVSDQPRFGHLVHHLVDVDVVRRQPRTGRAAGRELCSPGIVAMPWCMVATASRMLWVVFL